mmetsp:Transcript_81450/g.143843  ORF Transcript_81450/g.143843 Transcript_81450/m.143843 type:complete len:376 (-) Transcript_81450:28-1155(-)
MAGGMKLACACLLLSMTHLASNRVSNRFDSEHADLEASEGGSRWKFCSPWSTTSSKSYHFEIEPELDHPPTAVRLDRTAEDPTIRFFKNQIWSVDFKSGNELNHESHDGELIRFHSLTFGRPDLVKWMLTAMPTLDHQSRDPEVQEQIHSLPLDENAVLIYREDAEDQAGTLAIARQVHSNASATKWQIWKQTRGNYFPEELVHRSLARIRDKSSRKNAVQNLTKASAVAASNGFQAAGNFISNSIAIGGNTAGGVGAATGMVAAICCFGLLDTIPAYLGYGLGMTGGQLVGLGVGLAGAVPAGIFSSISSYFKYARESGLSMAEKIYEKMRCHPSFKECKGLEKQGKWVLVHKDRSCDHIVSTLLAPNGIEVFK